MKKIVLGLVIGVIVSINVTAFAAALPKVKTAMFTNSIAIEIDGMKQAVEIVSVIKDGEKDARNYVSVADISKALGAAVEWDADTQTIRIIKDGEIVEEVEQQNSINDEWITAQQFNEKESSIYTIGWGSQEIVFYETSKGIENIEPFLVIKVGSENTKVENNRVYIRRSYLVEQGIIKQ